MPMEYSLDNGKTWVSLPANTLTPTVPAGKKILWKSTLNQGDKAGRFQSQRQYNIMGNIMSVVFGDDFIGKDDLTGYDSVFYNLFRDANIYSAENLCMPATTLAESCCSYMFGFTNLTTAPTLPATTLAYRCYCGMFAGCRLLVIAPELPATTLAEECYKSIFQSCTSLVNAPVLPATTLARGCYDNMFRDCTALTTAPELPATALAQLCYYYMFARCTSLTTAPELPATTLAYRCYEYMFNGCTNLNYIKAMFTTTPSDTYTKDWVNGVSSTGTFVKSNDATWDVRGTNGIPEGWTVETESLGGN